MKRKMRIAAMAVGAAVCGSVTAVAQEQVEASVGADLVSGYIWRGQNLGGASLQPSLSVAYKGFSLGAWGSVNLNDAAESTKELDFTLGYETGGFTIGVADYWFGGTDYFHYAAHSTTHVFEAFVGYDFGPVAVTWFTNIGGDDYKADGDRAYSSYIEVSAPFKLGGLDWTAMVGATPMESAAVYGGTDGFAVIDATLKASKELRLSSAFTLPVFAQVTVNPRTEGAWFVFGASF